MKEAIIIVSLLLLLSLALNVYLFKKRNSKQYTIEARQLLNDLLSQRGALVRIVRVDPEDVLLRRPQ